MLLCLRLFPPGLCLFCQHAAVGVSWPQALQIMRRRFVSQLAVKGGNLLVNAEQCCQYLNKMPTSTTYPVLLFGRALKGDSLMIREKTSTKVLSAMKLDYKMFCTNKKLLK